MPPWQHPLISMHWRKVNTPGKCTKPAQIVQNRHMPSHIGGKNEQQNWRPTADQTLISHFTNTLTWGSTDSQIRTKSWQWKCSECIKLSIISLMRSDYPTEFIQLSGVSSSGNQETWVCVSYLLYVHHICQSANLQSTEFQHNRLTSG